MRSVNPVRRMVLSTSLGLALVLTSGTIASAATEESTPVSTPSAHALESRATDMTHALSSLYAIPDSVLIRGDVATDEWAASHGVRLSQEPLLAASQANVWGCAAAIATVIASTAIPAAKILKIKRLIESLGGVAKAVRILWGASFSYEKLQVLGGAAGALALEILGVTQIREQCFS